MRPTESAAPHSPSNPYPHGESNPGFRAENATSWATRRWGPRLSPSTSGEPLNLPIPQVGSTPARARAVALRSRIVAKALPWCTRDMRHGYLLALPLLDAARAAAHLLYTSSGVIQFSFPQHVTFPDRSGTRAASPGWPRRSEPSADRLSSSDAAGAFCICPWFPRSCSHWRAPGPQHSSRSADRHPGVAAPLRRSRLSASMMPARSCRWS